MRQLRWAFAGLAFIVLPGSSTVWAQTSLDALEQDLQAVTQQHKDAAAQNFSNFISQLDNARNSPDAAMGLYQQAGAPMPDSTPVQTKYDHETPHEKEARDQADAARLVNLASEVQLHCGLMRFGGVLAAAPDQKGAQADWIAWLKTAPQLYLQIKDDGLPLVRTFKGKALKDSEISTFLGFHSWGDKEQGSWSVKDIPKLYRTQVLEPLRTAPTTDTLAAWDVYISMRNADQPDNDKWTQVEYPALAFDRACDDYAVTPSMDKLQALLDIIKASPSCPKLDEMIERTRKLVADYRTHHPGDTTPAPAPAAAAGVPATNSNVNVTVVQQGDMTIVTTHTNAPSGTPPPPGPAPAP